MFDSDYFETHLAAQIEELGAGSTTVSVQLLNDSVFKIRRLRSVLSGYVLLEVFPEKGVTDESKANHQKPGGTDEVYYDHVAIPYESISHVFLTVADPQKEGSIGFHSET